MRSSRSKNLQNRGCLITPKLVVTGCPNTPQKHRAASSYITLQCTARLQTQIQKPSSPIPRN
uniref:Uncharacterized protein n=1 Tax=Cannabis sativa TaxID=3483 RepID=A0A803QZT7_CANSA